MAYMRVAQQIQRRTQVFTRALHTSASEAFEDPAWKEKEDVEITSNDFYQIPGEKNEQKHDLPYVFSVPEIMTMPGNSLSASFLTDGTQKSSMAGKYRDDSQIPTVSSRILYRYLYCSQISGRAFWDSQIGLILFKVQKGSKLKWHMIPSFINWIVMIRSENSD